ncbi:IS66 family transposase [Arcticibacter tournemirensis]
MALENLSKEQLIALLQKKDATIEKQDEKIIYLTSRVDLLERLQFGQKRERFQGDPAQGVLPFETSAQEEATQEEEIKEQITYTRKKQSAHKVLDINKTPPLILNKRLPR